MAPRGGKRKGSGRKAPAGVRITKAIRFSQSEWEQVEKCAQRLNITPSEYIRQAALGKLKEGGK